MFRPYLLNSIDFVFELESLKDYLFTVLFLALFQLLIGKIKIKNGYRYCGKHKFSELKVKSQDAQAT